MLGLIEALIAILAIVITCRIAGRIPAMMLTAVAAAGAAIIMPPFASWEVENTTDVLTVIFQTIIGLAVAYRWPPKNRTRQWTASFERPRNPGQDGHCLHAIVQAVMRRDQELAAKIEEIRVCGEAHEVAAIGSDKLEQILSDVLRLALTDPRIQRVRIYNSRQPASDQISLVAPYADACSLPRVRILGRSDNYESIQTNGWPANCSAAFFDNGFEHTYQISIEKTF
jgi:hypothetical protein